MLKDDTKVLALALPNFCVGHSAAVLTCLEHNHKRWLTVARAFVLLTSCNDRFRSCALAWSTTVDGGCGSMFALKLDVRACTRLLSVAAAARRSPLVLPGARRCCCTPLRCCCCTALCCSAATPLLSCCLRSGSSIWELAGAARYLDFRPASGRGERRKTLREA